MERQAAGEEGRMHSNGAKLKEPRSNLDARKYFLTVRSPRGLRISFSADDALATAPAAGPLDPASGYPKGAEDQVLLEQQSVIKNYQHFLAFAFAITELNKNPTLLPNTTLGFRIRQHKDIVAKMHQNSLALLCTRGRIVPNYKCDRKVGLFSVIGGLDSHSSREIASLLGIYKVPQLGYGVFHMVPGGGNVFPSFIRIDPSDRHQYVGLVQLLLHFHWNWIGLIAHNDDMGETFIQTLAPMLRQKDICVAFTEKFDPMTPINQLRAETGSVPIPWFEPQVIIVFADLSVMGRITAMLWNYEDKTKCRFKNVWVMTSIWEAAAIGSGVGSSMDAQLKKMMHGALHFRIQSGDIPEFKHFLQGLDPLQPQGDVFLQYWWERAFSCRFSNSGKPFQYGNKLCTGRENLEDLPPTYFQMSMNHHSYNIYNAVYSLAHMLHARSGSKHGMGWGSWRRLNIEPWQILAALRKIRFNNSAGDEVSFTDYGKRYDILNWITSPNGSFHPVKVGGVDLMAPPGQDFTIQANAITWATKLHRIVGSCLASCPQEIEMQEAEELISRPPPSAIEEEAESKMPFARCVERCSPGHRRTVPEGKPVCCYRCDHCPEGTISNWTDLVLATLIKHRDTPIVKANNRDLTYMLLASLLLCFLCAFLFIGRPGQITCLVRQAAFGITFSVAVSCILAKTVVVVLAFMATKPGNMARKLLGRSLTTSIVLTCSLIQAVICVVWLLTFPPFSNLDFHSLPGEIIVECNEGSVTMFYAVLAYMGFLAVLSFSVAFLARKLPDSFNEAKFITFSMLVFCSVWVSFVPSYLSTKGKAMVAVEVFSILASGAGLLAFIFLPKCYIILLRPYLNTREQLVRKKNV
ncbi:Vomeronasal type-2 receptor 26 [Varanus komodoensis]|nr:Vomeronasal type-2 receptor 26 [Varanus komodoensis]